MERKCRERRMDGEIRKTDYESRKNSEPIHTRIHMNTKTHTHTSTCTHAFTHACRPINTSVGQPILSLLRTILQPGLEKHWTFKLLTFWVSSLLGCDTASLALCFLLFLSNTDSHSTSNIASQPSYIIVENPKHVCISFTSQNNTTSQVLVTSVIL
jgi:hypothetical protein